MGEAMNWPETLPHRVSISRKDSLSWEAWTLHAVTDSGLVLGDTVAVRLRTFLPWDSVHLMTWEVES